MIVVEEANGEANFKNNDTMKAKLTQKKTAVNKKGVEMYEVNDYSRWCLFTNNRNPIPINSQSRRFAVMDTNPEKRGDEKYFKSLFAHLKEEKVKYAFFNYLKTLKDIPESPVDWFKSIPNTAALREVMAINTPPVVKWLLYNLKAGLVESGYVSDLYQLFRAFIKEKREGKEDTMMTETAFGILLGKNKETGSMDMGDKHRTASGQYFRWNIDNIVSSLMKQSLLEEGFEYTPCVKSSGSVTDSE